MASGMRSIERMLEPDSDRFQKGQPSILTIAGDPGGAAAIAPVIHELLAMGKANLRVLGYRQAPEIFSRRGIECETLPDSTTYRDCLQILYEHRIEVLLSATSVNATDLEQKFFASAREAGVPTLAVLDFWANYRRRFEDDQGKLNLPDRIAVMDDRALGAMEALGFPLEKLVVTGQPAFDPLIAMTREQKARRRNSCRDKMGLSSEEKLIVFMSQPLADFFSKFPPEGGHPGYTEQTAGLDLVRVLTKLQSDSAVPSFRLCINPHPRENADAWNSLPDAPFSVMKAEGFASHDLGLAADLVVGIHSMILLECAILGIPVVSYVPSGENPLQGAPKVRCCRSEAELAQAVGSLMQSSNLEQERNGFGRRATPIVIQQIFQLLDSISAS